MSTSEKAIRVLLPYLDMINHSSDNANAELHLIDPEKDDGKLPYALYITAYRKLFWRNNTLTFVNLTSMVCNQNHATNQSW